MHFQFSNGRLRWTKPTLDPAEILLLANELFRAAQSQDLREIVAEKVEELRYYDVPKMDRVASILMWGRSGSLLLASYFDGHDDVVMLPGLCGERLHEFFARYTSMPIRDKLLAFPAFRELYSPFFEGDSAIPPAQYYAAVQAILEVYGKWPPEFLESRRAFFLFVHIAYNLALGRRPSTPNPLILYAQHSLDDSEARLLVEDFPQARFIHTIRDPISSGDRLFETLASEGERLPPREQLPMRNPNETLPRWVLRALVSRDRPHLGMALRTRTVRFEDLHCELAETMRSLCDWLGVSWQATLVDSTINGHPWIVMRHGKAWSGPNREQTQRSSRHLSRKDRALLFASFYENFVAWDYPCPEIFRNPIVRCFVFVSLVLVPTNMEMIVARTVFRRRILPAIRHGNISILANSLLRIVFCRMAILWLFVPDFFLRRTGRKLLLDVDHKKGRPRIPGEASESTA